MRMFDHFEALAANGAAPAPCCNEKEAAALPNDSRHGPQGAPERLEDHPRYDPKSQRPIPTYVLVHEHPSRLLPVLVDKRERSGPDYAQYFSRFTEDVRVRGVLVPILAVRRGDALETADGETRRLAALMAGCETVPILVYDQPLSESDLIIAQLQANEMRLEFTDLERAQIYAKLMELNSWTQAQLARFINVSPAQVSKVMRISRRLPHELLSLIGSGEGQIPPSSAYQLSRLPTPEVMIEMGEKLAKGLLCRDAVEIAVTASLAKGKCTKRGNKPVKVVMDGVTVIIASPDLQKVFAGLGALDAAMKKLEKHGLPLAALPSLLKS